MAATSTVASDSNVPPPLPLSSPPPLTPITTPTQQQLVINTFDTPSLDQVDALASMGPNEQRKLKGYCRTLFLIVHLAYYMSINVR